MKKDNITGRKSQEVGRPKKLVACLAMMVMMMMSLPLTAFASAPQANGVFGNWNPLSAIMKSTVNINQLRALPKKDTIAKPKIVSFTKNGSASSLNINSNFILGYISLGKKSGLSVFQQAKLPLTTKAFTYKVDVGFKKFGGTN